MPRRLSVRTYILPALLLVAVGCSTSGKESADRSSTTVVPVATTTTTTVAAATTTTPAFTTTTEPDPEFPREDEFLVTFSEDCQTGYDEACDFLFLVSETDSEYEEIGATCGDRSDGAEFCTPGLDLVDGIATTDSPALQKLTADCRSGASMHACDLLFMVSEGDSEEEEIGDTCGGRIPEGADPACTIELGVAIGPEQ